MSVLACCGCLCDECDDFGKNCEGCNVLKGRPGWVAEAGFERCLFYECCVKEKGYEHCGKCNKMPCSHFYEYFDPTLSEEGLAEWIPLVYKGKHGFGRQARP